MKNVWICLFLSFKKRKKFIFLENSKSGIHKFPGIKDKQPISPGFLMLSAQRKQK